MPKGTFSIDKFRAAFFVTLRSLDSGRPALIGDQIAGPRGGHTKERQILEPALSSRRALSMEWKESPQPRLRI